MGNLASAERDRPVRVCLIGDSQLAAIRQGWSLIRDEFPGIAPTFFAGACSEWPTLEVCGDCLAAGSDKLSEQFARSSRGARTIGSSFDFYIICGLELEIAPLLKLWLREEHSRPEVFRAAASRELRETLSAKTLAMVREITSSRIVLLPSPFQGEAFCRASPRLDTETARGIAEIFGSECERLAGEFGATFLAQPAQTIAGNGVTTWMNFVRRSSDPALEDRRHGNAEYGAIALRQALEAVVSLPLLRR